MTGRAQREPSGYRKCRDLVLAGADVGVFYTPICRICERASTDHSRLKRFTECSLHPKMRIIKKMGSRWDPGV